MYTISAFSGYQQLTGFQQPALGRNGWIAHIAGAAGRIGERDKWGLLLPFALALARQDGATSRRSPCKLRTQ